MHEEAREEREAAEFSAKSEAEAVERAARDLGVLPEEVEYDIARDSTRNILGLVRTGEVTIRVFLPVPAEVDVAEESGIDPAEASAPSVATQIEPAKTAESAAVEEEDESKPEIDLHRNPPELESVASEVVATLLDKMGILAAVEVVDGGGEMGPGVDEVSPMALNIVGDDLGMLIGRRGETLRDLQFIARLIISRKLGVWPNLVVDVEGYKARREVTLRSLAQRMSDQVRRTGSPVTLEPMPAHERRIVHLTLRDDTNVYTESVGEGERRKVQILPK